MKTAFDKEVIRSITQSAGRFAAIALISLLGAGFYAGLRMAAPDMRIDGDEFFDGTALFDISVVSSMGLDDDSVVSLRQIEGVGGVMPAYKADAMALIGDSSYVASVESLPMAEAARSDSSDGVHALSDDADYLNRPILMEGAWPEKLGECVVGEDAALSLGIGIGERIVLQEERKGGGDDDEGEDGEDGETAEDDAIAEDAADAEDGDADAAAEDDDDDDAGDDDGTEDDEDRALAQTQFTVVGLVNSPAYCASSMLGPSTLGTGEIELYLFVHPEAFDEDYPYSVAYLSVPSALDAVWDTPAYDEAVAAVKQRVQDAAPAIADARYAAIVSKAQGELDDARKDYLEERADAEAELDDARKELDDARKELDDARVELDDAEVELDDARKELADAEVELADGEAELDDARIELEDARAELVDAKEELDDAREELESGRKELESSRKEIQKGASQLADSKKKIDESQAELEQAAAQLDESRAQLDQAKAQLDGSEAELEQAAVQLAELQGQISAMEEAIASGALAGEEAIAQLEAMKAQYEAGAAQLEQGRAAYEEGLAQYEQGAAELEAGEARYEAGLAEFEAGKTAYERAVAEYEKGKAAYEAGVAEYEQGKLEYEQGVAQYEEGRVQYEQGLAEYEDGVAEFEQGRADYEEGRAEFEDGLAEYEDGKKDYEEGLAEYEEGEVEYADGLAEAQEKFADAEAELADAQADIDDLDHPEMYVIDRSKNAGTASLSSDAAGIDQIALFLPYMFFLVAALVSLTSMTRMIDEERLVIGTHKALGYTGARITSKYLVYAGLASGLGSVVGTVVLGKLLPWFIVVSYGVSYAIPVFATPIQAGPAAVAIGLSLGITLAATWGAAASTLRSKPAVLMLPRAPKAGKRIVLERIGPLWRRFSFSQKVTARNLLRYKRRFFMAVVGVAGCTALLMVGFGLRDAIGGIVANQYEVLVNYDVAVRFDDDMSRRERSAFEGALAQPDVQDSLKVADFNLIAQGPEDDLRIEVIVPEAPERLGDFVTLRERVGQEALAPGGSRILLTEKASDVLGAAAGDAVMLYDENDVGDKTGDGRSFPVGGVVENYLGHYAYLLPEGYREAFGEEPAPNMAYVRLAPGADAQAFSKRLLDLDGVNTVSFVADKVRTYEDMLDIMNKLIYIIMLLSAALAFVVLYNLTNINIAERVREIATLKVLGFTRREVVAYIFREVMVMTFVGALAGCVLGVPLTVYIARAAETLDMMFGRTIEPASYVLSFAITLAFALIVAFAMRGKLARVNMVESLKSVE